MGKKKLSRTDILRICIEVKKSLVEVIANCDTGRVSNIDEVRKKILGSKIKIDEVVDNI